jgi:hypothetical protein
MIPGTSITKIFVIGNEQREPERIAYLKEYFESKGIHGVEYIQDTYKDTLTAHEIAMFKPTIHISNDRPFKPAEMSIFLNFLYLFYRIAKEFTGGHFLIFESDVRFESDICKYFQQLDGFIKLVKPEFLSIGSGCDLIDDEVNIDDMNFQIFPKKIVRCMDSFLISYQGIIKFIAYTSGFYTEMKYDMPIDNFLQCFFESRKCDLQYWVWPSLTIQGSQYGIYNSSIQDNSVTDST